MADSIPDPGAASPDPSPQPPVVLTSTLFGQPPKEPTYRFTLKVRKQFADLLGNTGDEANRDKFLNQLESLISHYQIYKSQDEALSSSESDAIALLEKANQHVTALDETYVAAWQNKAGIGRLRWAWAMLRAEGTREHPVGYVDPIMGPDMISRLSIALNDLKRLLEIATLSTNERNTIGGRPVKSREIAFVQQYATLSKEIFPHLSIRKKPLNAILEIALAEVGWEHTGIRPLLNKVEPPASRKKPSP